MGSKAGLAEAEFEHVLFCAELSPEVDGLAHTAEIVFCKFNVAHQTRRAVACTNSCCAGLSLFHFDLQVHYVRIFCGLKMRQHLIEKSQMKDFPQVCP